MALDDEPLLIFTTQVSKCANGFHLKIRKKDVENLNLAGKKVKIKVFPVDEDIDRKDPYEELFKG